jgi:translation initiation factor IF-3
MVSTLFSTRRQQTLGGVSIKRYAQQPPAKRPDEHLVNEGIRVREVMVISETGEKLGVMSKSQALDAAYDRDLDLFLVAPNAKPPVAKIMDYNKFKYEQQRKQREARKNQKITVIKEIRLSPKIDVHDFETKLRNARKFLEHGDKLKVALRFRGREMAHTNLGREVMMEFAKKCEDLAVIESHPTMDGRRMFMSLAPKKDK